MSAYPMECFLLTVLTLTLVVAFRHLSEPQSKPLNLMNHTVLEIASLFLNAGAESQVEIISDFE